MIIRKIDDEIKSKFRNEKHRAVVNSIYTGNFLQNLHENSLRVYDLSFQQFNILRILQGAKKQVNMNYIRSRLLDKSPNATRLTDRLVEKGLIQKQKSEVDKRVQFVKITPTGEDMISKVIKEFDDFFLGTLGFEEEDAKLLSQLLDKLRHQHLLISL